MIIISCYSGKCDCYDSLVEIHKYTLEELQNSVKIYVGKNKEPLHIEKMSDLIPYYPYIVSSASYNNKKKDAVIHLTSESYVDTQEKELLNSYLKRILKIYNRCKRKKIEFDPEDVVREMCWSNWNWNSKEVSELANRVKENGKKTVIDGIHLDMYEFYRKELVNEMIRNNMNPSEYGYERFCINKTDK